MEICQQARQSHNVDKALDCLTWTMKIREIYWTVVIHHQVKVKTKKIILWWIHSYLTKLLKNQHPYLRTRKKKQTKGPINSLETAWRQFIDENDYENYVPSILKNSTESEIDKELYQLEKSTVSRRCLNVANTSKRAAHPDKGCQNNTSIIEIWKQFVTMEIIDLILIIQIWKSICS